MPSSSDRTRPKKLALQIIYRFPEQGKRTYYDCLIEAIRFRCPSLSDAAVYEVADKLETQVREYINRYIRECDERRIPSKVNWSEFDSNRLVSRSFVHHDDPIETRKSKKKLLLLDHMRNALVSLEWRDFEKLCCKTLKSLGCRNVRRSRRDGGVDFTGLFPWLGTEVKFVGQAKKVRKGKRIDPGVLRDFSTAMRDRRCQIGVIMTTGSFSSTTRRFAKRKQIELIDGEQLSYELVKKGVGIENDDQNPVLNITKLRGWLQSGS